MLKTNRVYNVQRSTIPYVFDDETAKRFGKHFLTTVRNQHHYIKEPDDSNRLLTFVFKLTKHVAVFINLHSSHGYSDAFMFNKDIVEAITPAYNQLLGNYPRKDNATYKIVNLNGNSDLFPHAVQLYHMSFYVDAFIMRNHMTLPTGVLSTGLDNKAPTVVFDWCDKVDRDTLPEDIDNWRLDEQLVFYVNWFKHHFIDYQF